jgi:hypothetical protein
MSPAGAVSIDRRRSKFVALLGLAAVMVIALLGYLAWSARDAAIRGARTTTHNYAAILEARLDSMLRRADSILLERVRTLPAAALSGKAVPRYAGEINAMLDSHLIHFKELVGLRIFDANGDMLYT